MARITLRGLGVVSLLALAGCASAPRAAEPPRSETAPAAPTPEHPAESTGPMRQIAEMAVVIASVMEDATLLAAPKVAQAREPMPTRAELLAALDDYVLVGQRYADAIDNQDAPIGPRMEPLALRLRELVAEWTPTTAVPTDIQLAARALLVGMGVAEPPCGWDAFEGFRFSDE